MLRPRSERICSISLTSKSATASFAIALRSASARFAASGDLDRGEHLLVVVAGTRHHPVLATPIADLADRDAVLARRLDLKPFDRGRNRFFLGVGKNGAEVFGALADQINAPAGHQRNTLPVKLGCVAPISHSSGRLSDRRWIVIVIDGTRAVTLGTRDDVAVVILDPASALALRTDFHAALSRSE
jgi:hypothetical protein